MKVVSFEAKHLQWLRQQPGHEHLVKFLSDEQLYQLKSNPQSYTVLSDNEDVLLCGGVVEYWPGRGEGWATFNRNCKKEFVGIHNAVKRFLSVCSVKRIEAAVDVNFESGHRWMRALGFELEAPKLRAFLPGGRDASLYARVSRG